MLDDAILYIVDQQSLLSAGVRLQLHLIYGIRGAQISIPCLLPSGIELHKVLLVGSI